MFVCLVVCTGKCTLYARFLTASERVHHVDINVEGRKSLCLAASSTLISFASEHHPEVQVVSFELQFGDTETWTTEAHHFQV